MAKSGACSLLFAFLSEISSAWTSTLGQFIAIDFGLRRGQFIAVDLARGRRGGATWATCCHGLNKGGVVAGCD